MTWIDAEDELRIDELVMPIIGIASNLVRHNSGVHRHTKGQLLFAEKGTMIITLGRKVSILPPQRVAWIPPNLEHSVSLTEVVSYRSIYIDRSVLDQCPHSIFPLSPIIWDAPFLLKSILETIALSDWGSDWSQGERGGNLLNVLWDELKFASRENMHLIYPVDSRLTEIGFNQLPPSLDQLSKVVGASEKTITRIFQKETGLGYQAWRQQWRLLKSIELLSIQKLKFIDIALELGFSSDSAFSQFFKRMTGKSPSGYL